MAMQIIPGKLKGKDIFYAEECKEINLTDTLRQICEDFFTEETVFEDGEEITIEIAKSDRIRPLSEKIEKELFNLLEKLSNTKGDATKKELVADIKDLILFRSLIIFMLSSDIHEDVITIS